MEMVRTLPRCQFFDLQEVAPGVYAAMVREGSGASANAGIIDLGDATIVFDTMRLPRAGAELRAAAENLTGRPVTHVINSHWHRDHTYGTQAFPGTPIVATEVTREIIRKQGQARLEEGWRETEKAAEATAAKLAKATDEAERGRLATALQEHREFLADLPEIRLVLPTVTFADRMVFHGSSRRAELISYGPAHSPSDSFLYLPDDQIAFMGDVLWVQNHPNMAHGDPERWIETLERVAALDLKCAVPGHGPLGTRDDVALLAQYIREIKALARAVRESAAPAIVPAPYAGWGSMRFFEKSVSDPRF